MTASGRQCSPALSASPARAENVDPSNQFLSRMRLRRLEAEVIRDSILSISGKLNPEMGGPPVLLRSEPDGMVVVDDKKLLNPEEKFKRSVYLLSRRAY